MVDERSDLEQSSKAVLHDLERAWVDPAVAGSGAAVQLTVAAFRQGVSTSAALGDQPDRPIVGAAAGWLSAQGPDSLIGVYGESRRLTADPSVEPVFTMQGADFLREVLASHLLAVCYYGLNYGTEEAYASWRSYQQDYCDGLSIPRKEDLYR